MASNTKQLSPYKLSPNGREMEFSFGEQGGFTTRVTLMLRDSAPWCKNCKAKWCSHIAHVITDNADTPFMGAPDTELTGNYIEVPVVPTSDLWASVRIGDKHEATGAYKVYLKAFDEINEQPFLGFLHHGEGRNVLRGMIIDWFRANVSVDELSCVISAHGFKTQMRVEADMKSESGWLKQAWCMWTTDTCTYCRDAMAGIDDLIPGKT